jgi:hypothetical protein
MALIVILFCIPLSSRIGIYLSGGIFAGRPYRAVLVTVPILAGLTLSEFLLLQGIIDSNIAMSLSYLIALSMALISSVCLLMDFQFPSLIRMTLYLKNKGNNTALSGTLIWSL